MEQVQPEAFQPGASSPNSKLTEPQHGCPRAEDSRGPAPLGLALPSEPPGGLVTEDGGAPEEQDEQAADEGADDCTRS